MNRLYRAIVFLLASFLLATPLSVAQQLAISGTVDDTYGVLPEVSVTLRAPGGVTQTATTNAQGRYAFEGLIPGAYEITFTRQGFSPVTRTLSLTSEPRALNVTLTVAGVASSVDVVDTAGKTTGSQMEIPDREIPSQVNVVSQTTLQEQGITDVAAALENVSGVITQVQYGVYEWYTIGGVTQQSGNDFLYVDGMARTGNRSNTLINNVEEIQVFKGPNAVLYGGAGAGQGGMVNLIKKKPQATRANDVQYRVGRWGLQHIAGGLAGPVFDFNRVLYRVDVAFAHTDGWRQSGSKRFNVTPALTLLLSDSARITFNESFTADRYDLDAGIPVTLLARPGFPLDRRVNPSTDFQASRDWENQIVFNGNLTPRLQLRDSFYMRRNRDQYLDAETLSYNPTTDLLSRGELYFQHNRRPIQNQSDILGDYNLLGMRHRFMAGYEFRKHYNYSNRIGNAAGVSNNLTVPIPPLNIAQFLSPGFVDDAPVYTSFPRTRVDYSNNQTNAGYWQDQVDLTRRLRINVAGRFEDFKRRAHNDTYDNDQFVSAGTLSARHQSNYTYRAGPVFSLTQNQVVYAAVNTTFQPVFTIPADGNELEPTRSRSYEIGHKFQGLSGRLVATTALRKILNYNILIPLGGNLFEQAGKSSSRVVDLDLEGSPGRGIRAVASYGFADPRYDDFKSAATGPNLRGNRLPHAPKHTGRVWLTKSWKLSEKTSITTSLGARYVYRYFTNSANTVVLPSRGTMDGGVSLRRPLWDIAVNLENLTGKERYFVSQINGGTQLYPGRPFNATVTMRYRFN